jgi:hypothetical protein
MRSHPAVGARTADYPAPTSPPQRATPATQPDGRSFGPCACPWCPGFWTVDVPTSSKPITLCPLPSPELAFEILNLVTRCRTCNAKRGATYTEEEEQQSEPPSLPASTARFESLSQYVSGSSSPTRGCMSGSGGRGLAGRWPSRGGCSCSARPCGVGVGATKRSCPSVSTSPDGEGEAKAGEAKAYEDGDRESEQG